MPDIALADLALLIGFMLAIGAFAGVIAGLLGVGGGIVLVPAFYLVFERLGYESDFLMQVCLATSLATIVFTSARSVSSHRKKGSVDTDILRTWGIGIGIGAVAGVIIAGRLNSQVLQAIFGVLGCLVGLWLAFGKAEWRLGEAMPTGAARAATAPTLGFLSVLMGIGGGSFGVPLMTLFGVPIHRAVGTAAGFGLAIAVPSVLGFLAQGHSVEGLPPFTFGLVNIPAFLIIISMTLLTAPLGVKLAHALPARPLRLIFALFIFAMAANMLRKALMG
ncbi:putative membrane protein YfcA [Rubricella aquisinus]|uniref:Probable membrane transporter protein n=1 Tax=Rubricella aquisinus TaxID=2028108 RepID=A0A840WUT2_9RHOB|nr:sulfite exporter TauE/SafE family protein [Rubricella aquisinus]MBB5514970.1 putative membrane protein YfcA [Rubricella aquisinus]